MYYKGISRNPRDRISSALRRKIDHKNTFFDIHCHFFSVDEVPNGFLGVRLPLGKELTQAGAKILHKLNPYSNEDAFSNWAYFFNLLELAPEELINKLLSYYPENVILTPLMMDFQPAEGYGIRGDITNGFHEQREIMKSMQKMFPNTVLPFLAVDPRREGIVEIFKRSIFEDGFIGIKIYPSLGFLPTHPVLMEEIYPICEEYNIPITTHCAPATLHTSYHWVKNIKGKKHNWHNELVDVDENRWFWREKDYSYYFNSPVEWEPVLAQFPKLRLNFAHFGGHLEWDAYLHSKKNTWPSRIFAMMEKYDNVYADISYIFFDNAAMTSIKHILAENRSIRERTLFGSDFFLIAMEGHFRSFYSDCRILLGDEIFNKISNDNPKRFLGLVKGDIQDNTIKDFYVQTLEVNDILENEKEFIEKITKLTKYKEPVNYN